MKSSVQIELAIDAMSVYSATTAVNIKIPSEKSLLGHLQYLREKLDKRIFQALLWVDTRDMYADGMIKGSVDRSAITACMRGSTNFQYDYRRWIPSAPAASSASSTP